MDCSRNWQEVHETLSLDVKAVNGRPTQRATNLIKKEERPGKSAY